MWISHRMMRRLGFRRVSSRCWLCFRRHGLPDDSHLTVLDVDHRDPLELASFHVTFEVHSERLHFFYREEGPAQWRLEGHTPTDDFRRLGADRDALRQIADGVARQLVSALRGRWLGDVAV